MSVANPVIDYIDGPARRIHLRAGVTAWNPVSDIYAEVKQMRLLDESLRQFDMFVDAIPLIEKSPGKFTSKALILLKGTRISPFDESAVHTVTGELLSDEGISGSILIDVSKLSATSRYSADYLPPATAEVIAVDQDEIVALLRSLLRPYGLLPEGSYQMPPPSGGPVLVDGVPVADISGDCETGFTVTGRPE